MSNPTKSLLANLANSTRQNSPATETHFRLLVGTIMNLKGFGWPLLAGEPNRSKAFCWLAANEAGSQNTNSAMTDAKVQTSSQRRLHRHMQYALVAEQYHYTPRHQPHHLHNVSETLKSTSTAAPTPTSHCVIVGLCCQMLRHYSLQYSR